MLKRWAICLNLFAIGQALNQWRSGDCINRMTNEHEERFKDNNPSHFQDNSPSRCIKHCRNIGRGYKFAGVHDMKCWCGDEDPKIRGIIDNSKCKLLCPGEAGRTKQCGGRSPPKHGRPSHLNTGGMDWWNVFSLTGGFPTYHLFILFLIIRCSWQV